MALAIDPTSLTDTQIPNQTTVSQEVKPLEYELRLLAYIDVLGWSDLISRSVSDADELKKANLAASFFQFRASWVDTGRAFFQKNRPPSEPEDRLADIVSEVTHFSDTLVISCRANSFAMWSLISDIQQTCHHLLWHGHYTRGAIVLGQLAHRGNVIFGPALIEAYRLERDVAKYPRIIVKPDAVSYLRILWPTDQTNKNNTYDRSLRLDKDGIYYVDMLGFMAGHQNEIRRKRGDEEYLISLVKAKLVQDAHDLGRVAKHNWMLNYLEEVAAECTSFVETKNSTIPSDQP
jgi:hypothetical protein